MQLRRMQALSVRGGGATNHSSWRPGASSRSEARGGADVLVRRTDTCVHASRGAWRGGRPPAAMRAQHQLVRLDFVPLPGTVGYAKFSMRTRSKFNVLYTWLKQNYVCKDVEIAPAQPDHRKSKFGLVME